MDQKVLVEILVEYSVVKRVLADHRLIKSQNSFQIIMPSRNGTLKDSLEFILGQACRHLRLSMLRAAFEVRGISVYVHNS